jgi:beta-lactamase class D
MSKICRVLFCLLVSTIAIAQNSPEFPAGISGEFVSKSFGAESKNEASDARHPAGGGARGSENMRVRGSEYFRVNPAGCARRYAPYSTFKIPNSLIGVETGVVADPDGKWHWDAKKYPAPNPGPGGDYATIWQQDNNMRMALSNSIVWYYRELATKVGERRMKEWLAKFGYGNQDISSGIDQFWLGNSMKISPNEQVEFLTKLHAGQFPVAKKNLDTVKEILTQDSTPEYKLIAKTGSSGSGEGWLVGWVERADGGGCSFAMHMKAASHGEMAKMRPGLAREWLKRAGCVPTPKT